MTVSDREILNLLAAGAGQRNKGFDLLVKKYYEKLYMHIRRIVVDHEDTNDVLQNCFVKVLKNIDRFEGKSALYTWLYRIATNEALTFLKKQKRRHSESIDQHAALAIQLKTDPYFNGDEIQIKLQQAIDTLPDKQKAVFNMRYFEEMSYKHMSEVMDTSVGALKASYHHAAKKIEHFIKNQVQA